MGEPARISRSSGLRLLLRLASLLAALCVLCVSGRATAASMPVPMCGERNESIAAPPIFRTYHSGSIAATPCHHDALNVGHPIPFSPERVVIVGNQNSAHRSAPTTRACHRSPAA